jgi:hypothetical protein
VIELPALSPSDSSDITAGNANDDSLDMVSNERVLLADKLCSGFF